MKTNKNWKPVTISGFTGILMGAGSLKGMEKVQAMQGENATEEDNSVESLKTTVSSDDQSFSEAFNTARAELGPGGVFSWHGNLYNTYTAEEWNAMSNDDKNAFAQRVSPEVSPDEIDVTIANNDYQEPDVATAETASSTGEDDVRVVGYGEVTLDNGQSVTVQEMDINGQRVAVIDVDQDGEADYAMSDINHNRQMDEGEVIDLHTGETVSFTNDEEPADVALDTYDA